MYIRLLITPLLLALFSQLTHAAQAQNIGDSRKIAEALQSIPYIDKKMPYKNLADRMPNLGLSVSSMRVQRIDAQDAKESDGELRPGDIVYDFYTNEPNEAIKKACPIWSQFQFIKRGKKWLPTSRTAQFLSTWRCEVPKRQ